ncbi:MAG: amino acid adenylation domain-containing protein, partial [bacterium]|nr:amino acid adenylation domain-containing protein [bacterium]
DDKRVLAQFSGQPLQLGGDAGGIAYIIYTSGTTGRPKGVMLEHRGIVSLNSVFRNQFTVGAAEKILQFANISFDASVWEIFMALLNGASLYLPDGEVIEDPVLFQKYCVGRGITLVTLPPAYAGNLDMSRLSSLKMLITAGSSPSQQQVEEWSSRFDYINAYGPTESTICSTLWRAKDEPGRQTVTIGKPVANLHIYILNDTRNLQPIGTAGELCVSGVGVARGYLNNPLLTAEKFIAPPACLRGAAGPSGNSLYRTGDLARRLPDGNIEFLGRIDSQVKIRGYRIELKEIEAQLAKHEEIKETAVIDRNDNGDTYICAYIVSGQSGQSMDGQSDTFSADQLNSHLSQTLPDYMLPAHYVAVDTIPRTPAGKIDRKKLPPPLVTAGDDYTAPRDHVEKTLGRIWSDILTVEQTAIGIDADFFTIGGHSLKATRVTNRIHKELEVRLPLAELFKRPTIRGQAEYIRTAAQLDFSGIPAVSKKEYYPLSSAQKRMYFLQQMTPGSITYNMPMTYTLGRDTDKEKLETALKRLIARHESLRTAFIQAKGEAVQRIYDTVDFHMEYYDLSNTELKGTGRIKAEGGRTKDERKKGTGQINPPEPTGAQPATSFRPPGAAPFVRPFQLDRAPLLRSRLVKTAAGSYHWGVDIHHIVSDGTSTTLLMEDFIALYKGRELPPLRIQYKDYSQWQNHLFQSGIIKKQETYWLDRFKNDIPRLELPTDFKRPDIFTTAGAVHSFDLDTRETRKLRESAATGGGTLFMNILAVLNVLFYKYTAQEDIIIGSGTAGRHHADLQDIIGMFINTLVMWNHPKGAKSYQAFYKEVVATSLEAMENQEIQFEELVGKLTLERDPSRNPLFDISMVVQNFRIPENLSLENNSANIPANVPGPESENESKNTSAVEAIQERQAVDESPDAPSTSKFDMTFMIYESVDTIHFKVEYYTGIFKPGTIDRMVSHLKTIVRAVNETPGVLLKDIDILSPAEKEQILHQFNDTYVEYPRDKTIHQLFEVQVETTPHNIALVYRDHFLTYRQLNRRADQISRYLYHEKHVRPAEPVGLLMSQALHRPAGIFGILKTNAVYLPLDPALPQDRLSFMIKDARIGTIISEKKFNRTLNRLMTDCPCLHSFIYIDDTDIDGEEERDCNQGGKERIPAEYRSEPLHLEGSSGKLAYIIYTSGTTGRPKGVMLEHRGVVSLKSVWKKLDVGPGRQVLQFANISFDASIWEIFMALLTGASLYLPDSNIIEDPELFHDYMKSRCISLANLPPPFVGNLDMKRLNSLKMLVTAGSAPTPRQVEEWSSLFDYINGYGPTESTVCSTYWRAKDNPVSHVATIGKPIDNLCIYILNDNEDLQPVGVAGELCVSGVGVARGYLNNPQLTAEKFTAPKRSLGDLGPRRDCPTPRGTAAGGTSEANRFYHTGDLARRLPDGNIQFLGRIDLQVKIRGYRIELKEIENQLAKHQHIKETVVIDRDDKGETYICAYIVPLPDQAENDRFAAKQLNAYLSHTLPEYMLPSYFMVVDHIPLTTAGKIDRKKLPPPLVTAGDDHTAPRDHVEETLARIWSDILSVEQAAIGIDDN